MKTDERVTPEAVTGDCTVILEIGINSRVAGRWQEKQLSRLEGENRNRGRYLRVRRGSSRRYSRVTGR